jgi:hypothetical protein
MRIKYTDANGKFEPAIDAGGLAREWFQLFSSELFDEVNGLFRVTHVENQAYMINPSSESAGLYGAGGGAEDEEEGDDGEGGEDDGTDAGTAAAEGATDKPGGEAKAKGKPAGKEGDDADAPKKGKRPRQRPDHLVCFHALGRLLGRALFEGQQINAYV